MSDTPATNEQPAAESASVQPAEKRTETARAAEPSMGSCPFSRRGFLQSASIASVLAGGALAGTAKAQNIGSLGFGSSAPVRRPTTPVSPTTTTRTEQPATSTNTPVPDRNGVVLDSYGTSDTVPEASPAGQSFDRWNHEVNDLIVPFNGPHQPGIVNAPPLYCTTVALNLTITTRRQLRDFLVTVTRLGRSYSRAGFPHPLGITAPPADNGVLGAGWKPDGFTLTIGFGDSLFDKRFGLAGRRPTKLRAMTAFADDTLDPGQTGGDISLQLCANNRDTISHALRMILHQTRGAWRLAWKKNGYRNPSRPSGTPRNHFAFRDGTVNPDIRDPQVMDNLVWTGPGEPNWCQGGSYQVVRSIEMLTEFWDRITVSEQEGIFGRDRVTGAPLTGGDEFTPPRYDQDPKGEVVPLDAHIRLANPRTPETKDQMILRRAYNWDDGVRDNGTLDLGLLFICYQQDLERQFVTIQRRLEGEALADYLRPVGGGYFFCPPGARNDQDFVGSGFFA